MPEKKKMLFSIITVCYNAEKEIEKTIKSVLEQSCRDYEYIIVDGKSSDGTLLLCNKYQSEFQRKNIKFRIVSGKDNGIYDAMNKGYLLAEGQWITFLNAGDTYCSNIILEYLKKSILPEDDVVYGDTIVRYDGKKKSLYKLNQCPELKEIENRMIMCHQSVLIKRDNMNRQFNTKYRISADYDMILGLYLDNRNFHYLHSPICIYQLDGISERDSILLRKEACEIQLAYHLMDENEYNMKLKRLEGEIENPIRKWIKDTFLKRYIQWKQYKKFKTIGFSEEIPMVEWRDKN